MTASSFSSTPHANPTLANFWGWSVEGFAAEYDDELKATENMCKTLHFRTSVLFRVKRKEHGRGRKGRKETE